MNWSLDTAEQSLAIATATAKPAFFVLNGPITTIDQLLCKGIDIVEERVPAVHLPPYVVSSGIFFLCFGVYSCYAGVYHVIVNFNQRCESFWSRKKVCLNSEYRTRNALNIRSMQELECRQFEQKTVLRARKII